MLFGAPWGRSRETIGRRLRPKKSAIEHKKVRERVGVRINKSEVTPITQIHIDEAGALVLLRKPGFVAKL
jgi:hypothetical protein